MGPNTLNVLAYKVRSLILVKWLKKKMLLLINEIRL